MTIQSNIEQKLKDWTDFSHLEVINESYMHAVPPDSETHFKVVAVSASFAGMSKVVRHQNLYRLLADEIGGPVHALALHLFTPEEWSEQPTDSPACMGGSKQAG